MEEKSNYTDHNVIIDSRKKLSISGVKDVVSFDDETAILVTVMGKMTVKGENLKMISFDNESGSIAAEGRIHAVVYMSDAERSGGFLSRLFR